MLDFFYTEEGTLNFMLIGAAVVILVLIVKFALPFLTSGGSDSSDESTDASPKLETVVESDSGSNSLVGTRTVCFADDEGCAAAAPVPVSEPVTMEAPEPVTATPSGSMDIGAYGSMDAMM